MMRLRKIFFTVAVVTFLLGCWPVTASESTRLSDIENLVRSKGKDLYWLAWSTAKYSRVDIERIEPAAEGVHATVVLRGQSALTGDEIWVRALITIRDGAFVDLKWREHSRVLIPPGTMVQDLQARLQNLNRRPPDPAELEARRKQWEEFDRIMKARFTDYRNDMDRLIAERNRESAKRGLYSVDSHITRLYFRTSPGCHVFVAVRFKALDGQWVTFGWMRAEDDPDAKVEELDSLTIESTASTIWLYARSTKGRLYDSKDDPEDIMHLPVIPGRNFIRRGDEELSGPDLIVVPFFKRERLGQRTSSRTTNFGCYL